MSRVKRIEVLRQGQLPQDFGAVGDGVTDDAVALQAWIDSASGAYPAIPWPGTYMTSEALWVRKDYSVIYATGMTIKAVAATQLDGALVCVANCKNGSWTGGTLDVNEGYVSAMTLIGLTHEFAAATAMQTERRTENWVVDGVTVKNARFHINNRHGVTVPAAGFSGDPAPGDILTGVDETDAVTHATVVSWDSGTKALICDWHQNRYKLGGAYSCSPSGAVGTTGRAGVSADRINVSVNEPISGISFNSWFGLFGGKGFSIQSATSNVEIKNFVIDNCDNGFTIEGIGPSGQETEFTRASLLHSIHDGTMTDVFRAPFWISNANNTYHDLTSVAFADIDIVDPCEGGQRFGIFSGDRAGHITATGIVATVTGGYNHPYDGFAGALGAYQSCDITMSVTAADCYDDVDTKAHARWGNAPGTPAGGLPGNTFNITVSA